MLHGVLRHSVLTATCGTKLDNGVLPFVTTLEVLEGTHFVGQLASVMTPKVVLTAVWLNTCGSASPGTGKWYGLLERLMKKETELMAKKNWHRPTGV